MNNDYNIKQKKLKKENTNTKDYNGSYKKCSNWKYNI